MIKTSILVLVLVAGFWTFEAAEASSAPTERASIKIANAWAREASLASGVSAVYLSLVNTQAANDTLLSVSTPAAKRAEVHETTIVNGIAHMRPIPALELPPNATVSLSPAGKHIMLLELTRPLRRGATLTLSLAFAHAGEMRVVVPVFFSGHRDTNVRQPALTHDEH